MQHVAGRLIVAWKAPESIGDADAVLSFLPPGEEEALERAIGERMISGRVLARQVRESALDTFAAICSGVGVSLDRRGRTLRSALRRGDACSDWWFHPLSSRSWASGPPVLELIVALFAIDLCAAQQGMEVLSLCGAPSPLVSVLRRRYRVAAASQTWRPASIAASCWPAFRSRWSLMVSTLRVAARAPRPASPHVAGRPRLVALTAAWHLWLRWDEGQDRLVDTHYRGVDEALSRSGAAVIRYVWLPPRQLSEPSASWRRPFTRGEAVVLQTFLTAREIVREALSLRPWLTYARWIGSSDVRDVFHAAGFDLYPLFRFALANGFMTSQIGLCRLTALATERASRLLKPAAAVCHFEQLPSGCAHYEGIRRAGAATLSCTMQHSSNTDGRFYRVDPQLDVLGEPDGCPVPRPTYVFAMGEAGRDRFVASGYEARHVPRTGSARFDQVGPLRDAVRRRTAPLAAPLHRALRLLVVPTNAADLELIEAACAAAAPLPDVEVLVRQKPGDVLAHHPRFTAIASHVRLTTGSLAEDIAAADVVLFTQSTVGDQAFACGVPTWQWLSIGLEASALVNMARIPQFDSVGALREALATFRRNPQAFLPPAREVDRIVRAIFGRADGGEAQSIADHLVSLVAQAQGFTTPASRTPVNRAAYRAPAGLTWSGHDTVH